MIQIITTKEKETGPLKRNRDMNTLQSIRAARAIPHTIYSIIERLYPYTYLRQSPCAASSKAPTTVPHFNRLIKQRCPKKKKKKKKLKKLKPKKRKVGA